MSRAYANKLESLAVSSGPGGFVGGVLFAWLSALAGFGAGLFLLAPLLIMAEDGGTALAVAVIAVPLVGLLRWYIGAKPAYFIAERKKVGPPLVWGFAGFLIPWLVVGIVSCLSPRS